MKKEDIKKLIGLFAEKTDCAIQFNGCPCNTCFHAIKDVDFQHVAWLMLLGIRGDYKAKEILASIEKELGVDA